MTDYELFMNGSIVQDYSEFSNQSMEEIVAKMLKFKELTLNDFKESTTQEDFYLNTKNYIYDLLTAHPTTTGPIDKINKFLPGLLDYIKEHPGKKFLEFGGGIGDVCQYLAEWGQKDVTYMDIQSHITDFAMWRFKKYNVNLKTEIIPQEDFVLTDTYDFVYQDAVLEHLSPEKQISYTDKLARAVNRDGLFIMIVDLCGETDDMPMHFNVDINAVHNAIENVGLICHFGRNEFASVWSNTK